MNQNERVLGYMVNHPLSGITQFLAMKELGVQRLAARIKDLRDAGHTIVSEWASVSNRFGEECKVKRYRIVPVDYRKR